MIVDPAFASVRARRNLSASVFDEDTRFVVEVLTWLRSERASGRLVAGSAVSFVRFDFRKPRPAAIGSKVDLRNGGVVAGSVHVCNDALGVVHRWPGCDGLSTMSGHADALASIQMAADTSLIFDPTARRLEIRMACLPEVALHMILADGLDPHWSQAGLGSLNDWIDRFHALIEDEDLFHEGGRLRAKARVLYRNAMYLYLTYQLGLTDAAGFRVTAENRSIRIRQVVGGKTALITAIGSRSSGPGVTARWLDIAAEGSKGSPLYVSCLACVSGEDSSCECGVAPISLRHRHVAAA